MEKLAKAEADIQSVDPRRQVALPNMVFWTIGIMGIFAGWAGWEQLRSNASPSEPADSSNIHVGRMLGAIVVTGIFVTMLAMNWIPLGCSIAAFMLVCGGLLGAFRNRITGAALILLTAGISTGFHYLFTQLFVIDL